MKFFKIFILNLIFLFFVIIFFEAITFVVDYYKLKENFVFDNRWNIQPYYTKIYSFKDFYNNFKNEEWFFRSPSDLLYKNRPIILFGCSFTYGQNLEQNQTMSYKLSQYTNRAVINRAHSGWGIQHMLWQLKNDKELTKIPNPEYIIYTFIPDHIGRLYSFCYFNHEWYLSPAYKILRNNSLKEIIPPPPQYIDFIL